MLWDGSPSRGINEGHAFCAIELECVSHALDLRGRWNALAGLQFVGEAAADAHRSRPSTQAGPTCLKEAGQYCTKVLGGTHALSLATVAQILNFDLFCFPYWGTLMSPLTSTGFSPMPIPPCPENNTQVSTKQPTRLNIINAIINEKQLRSPRISYLEIGIRAGGLFTKVSANQKVGVDPLPAIPLGRKISSLIRNAGRQCIVHKCTSDEYFRVKKDTSFDVVFIDGMHTYEQVMRDIFNSLQCLKPGGIILIHDCLPPHAAAATSAASAQEGLSLEFDAPMVVSHIDGWDGVWCGDVWKSLLHCHQHANGLSCSLLDTDMGIGVIVRSGKQTSEMGSAVDEAINRLTYHEYVSNHRHAIPTISADQSIQYVQHLASR